MLRRRFLLVCTTAVTGLWLRESGLTRLSRQVVIEPSGNCSFCGSCVRKVSTMARAVGTPIRICSECIALCLDIIDVPVIGRRPRTQKRWSASPATEHQQQDHHDHHHPDDDDTMAVLSDLLKVKQARANDRYSFEVDKMIATMRARLDGTHTTTQPSGYQHQESGVYTRGDLRCAFCTRHQNDVARLIAGPTVYICDGCVVEAASITKKLTQASPIA